MRTGHAAARRFFYHAASSFVSLSVEAIAAGKNLSCSSERVFVTAPFLLPLGASKRRADRHVSFRDHTRRRNFSTGRHDNDVHSSDSNVRGQQQPSPKAPISLADLLGSTEPKSPETKQLIWRAWSGLSEDHQAARIQLLDSLLEMLQTEEPQDARRLRSLLDAKFGLIDTNQRPFYSFWAHMILHEPDIAFRHFQSLHVDVQRQFAELFMRKIVETGDWASGVKLWYLSRDWTVNMRFWHAVPSIRQLLDLIPALQTWQFLTVLSPDEAEAFKAYIRPALVIHLAASGKVDEALQLVRQIPLSDLIVRDSEIAMTIRALSKVGRHEEGIQLYQTIVDSPAKPQVIQRMSVAVLRAATLLDTLDQLRNLLQGGILFTFTAVKGKIRLLEVYTMIMSAFARYGQVAEVEQLFQSFLDQHQKPDAHMLGTLLQARVKTLEVQEAMEIFSSCQATYGIAPDLVLHNMLLTLYADTLDVDGANQIIELSKDAGMVPDVITASTLIDLYAHRKNAARAQQIFNQMCATGVVPNVNMWGSLMNAYVDAGDFSGMQTVLSEMEAALIKPNSYIMNIVLKGLVKDGRSFDEMSALVKEMGQFGARPTGATYTMLLRVQIENLNLRAAIALFRSIPSPNQFHYTVLMVGCLRQYTVQAYAQVQKYYDEMLARGLEPTNITTAVLINACLLRNTPESKEQVRVLLDTLSASQLDLSSRHAPRTAPMAGIYRLFFRKMRSGANDVVNSNNLFKKFLHSTLRPNGSPDLKSLTAIMGTYESTGQLDKVRSLFVAIKKEADRLYRYDPDDGALAGLTPPTKVSQVSRAARYILVAPLSILMRALARAQEFEQIERVWKAMREQGYEFDEINWNQYIRAQLSQGDIERGLFLMSTHLSVDEGETQLYKIRPRTRKVYAAAFKFLQTEGVVTTFNGEEEKGVVWQRIIKNYRSIVDSIAQV